MNQYAAFYKGKTIEVEAETSLKAQLKAAEQFKARKRRDVGVILVGFGGVQVTHKPQDIAS